MGDSSTNVKNSNNNNDYKKSRYCQLCKQTVEIIVAITMYRKIEVAAPDDNLY